MIERIIIARSAVDSSSRENRNFIKYSRLAKNNLDFTITPISSWHVLNVNKGNKKTAERMRNKTENSSINVVIMITTPADILSYLHKPEQIIKLHRSNFGTELAEEGSANIDMEIFKATVTLA